MNKKSVSIPTCIVLILLAVVTTANLCVLGMTELYNKRLGNLQETETNYKRLKELISVVDRYFVGEYDMKDAMDGVLAGFVDGMGDRWSCYYNEEQYQELLKEDDNSYVGIGVTIDTQGVDGGFRVTEIASGSPAKEAGIHVGDVILEADGQGFETYTDLVQHVRGEAGTTVVITVLRGSERLQFSLERAAVHNADVEARMIGELGYMHIDSFHKNDDVEFVEKLNQLIEQGARGLIFDVRFNGGGYVDVMNNMLDQLLPECTIITMSDNKGETTVYRSDEHHVDLPIAVLTNEYSISAAEFFAAVLQEYGVAVVVGDKTIGKGYAQTLIPLSEGAVNLSTLKYYTPKGVSLAGVGVTPDVEISLSDEDFYNFYSLTDEQDTQLQKAIEIVTARLPQ